MLYETAASHPRGTAIVYRDERVSHVDLLERVERLASGLAGRGICPGDAVALVLGNEPSFVVGFHAITGLGGVVVPLNPQFKRDELEMTFRRCEVSAVITDERTAGLCERIVDGLERPAEVVTTGPTRTGRVTLDGLIEESSTEVLTRRAPDDPFVYQFSSGSTGRPKRVPRSQRQCWSEAQCYATSMGIAGDDKIFCAIPFFHTYGMGWCVLAAARTGATLVILEDPNPFVLRRERALELLERERATWFPGVPFSYRLLADTTTEADLSSLRMCFSAGTALPQATFQAFRERFGLAVRQLYGCTEAGTLTVNMDADPVSTSGSVGRPVGDVRVSIVDGEGNHESAEVGEIAVSSSGLTSGYSDMYDLNRRVFRDGYFLTGDLGRLDDEGRLYITGRKKLLIEVGGYKVDPIEVEDVVAAHPAVREAVIVGAGSQLDGEQVVKAVVVPSDSLQEREVIKFCQERLANFKVPRIVEFRDEIPRSPLGKVLRKYLV